MNKIFLLFIISTLASTQTKTQTINIHSSYDISFTFTPLKNEKIYLAGYYGKSNMLIDSCVLDEKSNGHFKGTKKLSGGIYFLVNKNYKMLFDIVINNDQHFSIEADTSLTTMPKITGCTESTLSYQFNQKRSEIEKSIKKIADKYSLAKNSTDSATIKNKVKQKLTEFENFKHTFFTNNNTTLIVKLLKTAISPNAPETYLNPETNKIDSNYPFNYVKEHYLDEFDFTDDRLLRTPFFDTKIDDYFKNYISLEADSIIPQVKYMLLSARTAKELYPYLLIKFTNKYLQPEYMGQDKVFIYLFKEHYLKGDTSYLDTKSKKTIIDRGYFLILNQLYLPAPAINLIDTTGKPTSLYNLTSKYTFIAYWSPTCGHCKQEIPILDSIYKNKWKAMGVSVYSILSEYNLLNDLQQFIKEKNLSKDWIYVYESKALAESVSKNGEMNFRQAYDFTQTPVFYLLDENKKIIAKKLSIEQFDKLLTRDISK